MGLQATARGLTSETEFNCGYITYGSFIQKLINQYDARLGIIYERWSRPEMFSRPVTEEELVCLNHKLPLGLRIWAFHSDCDGKFTPQECKIIYDTIKDMKMDVRGHNYGVMKSYNMLEHWKNIFLHCWKRRVNLYFR